MSSPIVEAKRRLRIAHDRRKRLIELVRERGGKLTHRAQARRVLELRLQDQVLPFSVPLFAHVEYE